MKLYKCQACGQIVHFENTVCEKCSRRLGYLAKANTMSALEELDGGRWRALAEPRTPYRLCQNAAFDVCNWAIEDGSPDLYCRACRHNNTVPDVSVPANLQAWRKIEFAKHRLFYSLIRLNLPVDDGLTFDFLAASPNAPKVLTGHNNGHITIALEEAHDAEREKRRTLMKEPYRTLLGHFRHEVGHYFWDQLVVNGGKVDMARNVFGDERADYGTALQKYYAGGPPAEWQETFVSGYAAAHPSEDFAETWAHYLHIVDTLEMAHAFGVDVHPRLDTSLTLHASVDFDAYRIDDGQKLLETWLPLSVALNSLSRAMGHADFYPFVLSQRVIAKIVFVHELVRSQP
jgi:hypothetical protein